MVAGVTAEAVMTAITKMVISMLTAALQKVISSVVAMEAVATIVIGRHHTGSSHLVTKKGKEMMRQKVLRNKVFVDSQ